jgi:threonyl-tRNA synthetase
MAILIEHYAGAFPVWLAPVQVKILPISDKHLDYARQVLNELKQKMVRVELDDATETLGKKIRQAKLEKIPYLVVIGDQEVASKLLTVESRDQGKLSGLGTDDFYAKYLKP